MQCNMSLLERGKGERSTSRGLFNRELHEQSISELVKRASFAQIFIIRDDPIRKVLKICSALLTVLLAVGKERARDIPRKEPGSIWEEKDR